MSILDQRRLIESIHPFELLSTNELDNLMAKVDIAYYPQDTLLISKDLPSIAFYIIIKGSVNEFIDNEIHNVYTAEDSFDADALIYNKCESKFVVDEDLICYEIKKDDFLLLMQNKKVQGYFLQDFVSKHQHLKEYDTASELTPFLISKVSDIFLHSLCIVDADMSIYDALVKQKNLKSKIIIVNDNEEYYVVTDTDLRDKVLLSDITIDQSIKSVASSSVISIDINDFLFNALLMMTHSSIKRLVVKNGSEFVGVLEQIDLLSFFANHSHLVAVQIDKAEGVEDLKNLQDDLYNLILTLKAKGVKVRYITKLVSTLNIKIYNKIFRMCVPEELQDKCALIVMGSEGREEQSVKTDQDNALIIKDGVDTDLFTEPMIQLNKYLLEIGFPKCDGNVMVTNEYWRRDISSFKQLIKEWVQSMNETNVQSLSIFLDSKFVAGDETLFDELYAHLFKVFNKRNDVLAHIAKAVLSFETPLSLFSGFVLEKDHNNKLDLKKGGVFALVHGMRTLSLEHGIMQTNTIERIKELNNIGVIDKNFATELIESFDSLSSIRLQAMLTSKDRSESNYINPKNLEKNQRDLLKDSFKIINKFKKFMTYHFHLEMVS